MFLLTPVFLLGHLFPGHRESLWVSVRAGHYTDNLTILKSMTISHEHLTRAGKFGM